MIPVCIYSSETGNSHMAWTPSKSVHSIQQILISMSNVTPLFSGSEIFSTISSLPTILVYAGCGHHLHLCDCFPLSKRLKAKAIEWHHLHFVSAATHRNHVSRAPESGGKCNWQLDKDTVNASVGVFECFDLSGLTVIRCESF